MKFRWWFLAIDVVAVVALVVASRFAWSDEQIDTQGPDGRFW